MKKIIFFIVASLFLFACGDSTGNNYNPDDFIHDTSENPVNNNGGSGGISGGGSSQDDDDDDDDDETINRKICGKIKKNSYEKIINGTKCDDEGSPVMMVYTVTNKNVYYCSGTLIDTNTVLTAGHCFHSSLMASGEEIKGVIVKSGADYLHVKSYIVNPDYDINNGIDSAVVKLEKDVDNIDPVAIITSYRPSVNEKVIAYGYGLNEDGYSQELRAAYLKVDSVTDAYLITKYDTTKTSTCTGDSGGPIVGLNSSKQAGIYAIISRGTSLNCMAGEVGYDALISNKKNLDFILANSNPSTL